ncbi:MAG TPA: transcription antitermination factor NusB [Woeseiaceae bacterium]|nr:transcription antitermination factor NusB [Woeseiaceae bacterium]
MAGKATAGARTRARELLLQALYQKQIAGHDLAELRRQFHEQTAWQRVDQEYFDEALGTICREEADMTAAMSAVIDRPLTQLDPVEFAILLLGIYELRDRIDVPYRVVINEGVNLARRFGAVDGHKYINACLDRAAQTLRRIETQPADG